MEELLPGLYATAPGGLSFAEHDRTRAFLLRRDAGNLLIYNSEPLASELAAIDDLGGVHRHYLSHWHEARFGGPPVNGSPIFVPAAGRAEVEETHASTVAFEGRQSLGEDFEIIPIPGHTPDATAFVWNSGTHRVLFTGDSVMLNAGEWIGALLDSSDRLDYLAALERLAAIDFDVLAPWIAHEGDPPVAYTHAGDARERLGAIADRIRAGADR